MGDKNPLAEAATMKTSQFLYSISVSSIIFSLSQTSQPTAYLLQKERNFISHSDQTTLKPSNFALRNKLPRDVSNTVCL